MYSPIGSVVVLVGTAFLSSIFDYTKTTLEILNMSCNKGSTHSIIIYSCFTREFPTGGNAFLQGTLGTFWWMREIQLVT